MYNREMNVPLPKIYVTNPCQEETGDGVLRTLDGKNGKDSRWGENEGEGR